MLFFAINKFIFPLFRCDLTNEDEILAVFQKIREDFGRIDICINNAGFSSNTSLMTGRTEDWRDMIDVLFYYYYFDLSCYSLILTFY